MFDKVSFEKMLSITANDMEKIRDTLSCTMGNIDKITYDELQFALTTAFLTVTDWAEYYNKFKEVTELKTNELNIENAQLKTENKLLKQQLSSLKDDNTETAVLKERIKYLEEIIKIKDNNSNLLPVDLIETLNKLDNINKNFESAISSAQHDAARKVYRQRVASGEVTPAKRLDVDDEVIKTEYLAGKTPNAIAKQFGMTQSAIIYRLKKLGIYVNGGRQKNKK